LLCSPSPFISLNPRPFGPFDLYGEGTFYTPLLLERRFLVEYGGSLKGSFGVGLRGLSFRIPLDVRNDSLK